MIKRKNVDTLAGYTSNDKQQEQCTVREVIQLSSIRSGNAKMYTMNRKSVRLL